MLKPGIQLYSVRQSLHKDPYGTLAKVADAGYRYVEAANHNARKDPGVGFGVPASAMKEHLERLGLQIVGSHINPLDINSIDDVLDYHQELGNEQIGCDIEFYPYNNLDYVKERCSVFNAIGERCRQRGMRFYYHNHYQEFQIFDSKTVFQWIMEYTDPELVFLELDTYWVARGGVDPVALIQEHNQRLVLLHQKDFPKEAPQPLSMYDGLINPDATINMDVFDATKHPRCFVEIGSGSLPIQDIINAAQDAPHLEYILLEQDHTQLDEILSIQRSMEGFKKFTGIAWE